jgi:hypothetical protein
MIKVGAEVVQDIKKVGGGLLIDISDTFPPTIFRTLTDITAI